MKIIISLALLIASGVGAFVYIAPEREKNQELRSEIETYRQVKDNADRLLQARDDLTNRFQNLDPEAMTRLRKMLPDTAENVNLILELQTLAEQYDLFFLNADVIDQTGNESQTSQASRNTEQVPYGTLRMSLALSGPYEGFVGFLERVEQGLRLIDTQVVRFQAPNDSARTNYEYNVEFTTYWLK
jgi:Tfp pilus assembly protein PilO